MTAPQCVAEPHARARCVLPAVWAVRIHSPLDGHGPDDTVWRVLCRGHAIELLKWVQGMETLHDTVWCNDCNVMLQPREWLLEDQDMDIVGWVEWQAAQGRG